MPTLADIQAMNRPELEKLAAADFVAAILREQRVTTTTVEEDEYHNRTHQIDETFDGIGSLVEEKIIRWTYYDAEQGIIDEIIIEDAKEVATVKHTLDGKQPTIKRVAIARAISEPIEEA